MTEINKFNSFDLKKQCVKCTKYTIEDKFMQAQDWYCTSCHVYQLAYIKSRGYRYYAFLLSGSWTSEYIKARSLKEAYKRAVKMYKIKLVQGEKVEVRHSYLVGGVDQYVLKGWFSFNR